MPRRSISRLSCTGLIAAGGWRPLNPWAARARRRACLMEKDSVAGMSISLSARNLPHREGVCVATASSFMDRIIPEWPDRLMLDVGTTDADVFQRFIAQTRQQLTFTVKFVPSAKLVQQIGHRMQCVSRDFFFRYRLALTFHHVALLWDGPSLAPELRSIQRMFLMLCISEIDECPPTPVLTPMCCAPSWPSPIR